MRIALLIELHWQTWWILKQIELVTSQWETGLTVRDRARLAITLPVDGGTLVSCRRSVETFSMVLAIFKLHDNTILDPKGC
jgi:hypothetical protein